MPKTYRTAEFAKLAGVTVRTLQYYDRLGLVKPSGQTDAGHRLYHSGDLLRMQQVLGFKWMGFRLSEIKTILDSPSYDLHTALSIQKGAVDSQIDQLQEASAALEKALALIAEADATHPDPTEISDILRQATLSDPDSWIKTYYSEAAWDGIVTRRLALSSEQMAEATQSWDTLLAAFERELKRKQPPDSPAVQKLAAEMFDLIEQFTGGDPEALAGLKKLNSDVSQDNLPPGYRNPYEGIADEVRHFAQEAYLIYQERKKR